MEPEKKLSTDLAQKNIDPITFFDKDEDFVLAYKKTEKLAGAVYMVTNFFSENEPMKWTLRRKVSEMLSFMISYKDISESVQQDFVYNAKTHVLETVSFLEISMRGGLVSQMNFSVLKNEFLNLINILSVSENAPRSPLNSVISKGFFDVQNVGNYLNNNKEEVVYSNTELSNINQRRGQFSIKDKAFIKDKSNIKKSNRQDIILGLLKKKEELTIKDVALVIKDCSEKTIQRELNNFISTGVLKRTGVRRWSKYSLA